MKILGLRYPDILISINNLVFIWKDIDRYETAFSLI